MYYCSTPISMLIIVNISIILQDAMLFYVPQLVQAIRYDRVRLITSITWVHYLYQIYFSAKN